MRGNERQKEINEIIGKKKRMEKKRKRRREKEKNNKWIGNGKKREKMKGIKRKD